MTSVTLLNSKVLCFIVYSCLGIFGRVAESAFGLWNGECWAGGRLAGGLYGVRLGGAFFGESMVSFQRDASKVALVHLVARLKAGVGN